METVKRDPFAKFKLLQTKLREREDQFQQELNSKSRFNPQVEEDFTDIFCKIFQSKAEYQDKGNTVLKSFLSAFEETEEFKNLKDTAKNNAVLSKLASKKLFKEYSVYEGEAKKEMEKQKKDKQTSDDSKKSGKPSNAPEMGNFQPSKDTQQITRMKMRKVCENTEETLDEAGELISNLGYSKGNGDNAEEDRDYYKLLCNISKNKSFRKIMEMAGRYKRLSESVKKTTCKKSDDEIIGVEFGNDISRILPDEFMLYQKNKALFFQNHADDSLMQWEMGGKEPQGKGPFILYLDGSGSMRGKRTETAKSIAFGIMNLAEEEKRKFYVIEFGGTKKEVKEWNVKNRKDMIEIINHFYDSGGTAFNFCLDRGIEILQSDQNMKKADMIFITDGVCPIEKKWTEEFLMKKAELDFKMISLQVGGGGYSSLEEISDKVYRVSHIDNELETDEFLKEIYSL